MGDIALRGNKLTRGKGQSGHGPIPYLNKPGQAQGTHGGKAKGGRIGLKHGTKPWGTGPKPGTHEFLEHHLHKPRKGKAAGSIIKGAKKAVKTIINKIKKKKRHESLDIPGSPGPEIGKYPGIDKAMSNIKKSGDIWGPGKAAGGRIGKAAGGSMDPKHHKPKPPRLPRFPDKWKPRQWSRRPEKSFIEQAGGSEKAKPHSTKEGRIASGTRRIKRLLAGKGRPKAGPQAPSRPAPKFGPGKPRDPREPKKFGPGKPRDPREPKKYQPAAEGGRIGFKKGGSDKNWIQKAVNPKHKGFCTPMTKKTCTPRRKALARTFKKMGRERKAKG